MALSSLGSSEAAEVSSFFNQPADNYGNDEGLEMRWAMKAFHHAETYFNLITSVDPALLKLTRIDDAIYQELKESFPDLDVEVLDEDKLKSKQGKEEWRVFCEKFKERVEDFNMGTLVRIDSRKDISEQNTILATRIQFLAIEIARNRGGFNNGLRQKFGKSKPETGEAKDTAAETSDVTVKPAES